MIYERNKLRWFLLGSLYREGGVVKKDLVKAREYYGIMCDAKEPRDVSFIEISMRRFLRRKIR